MDTPQLWDRQAWDTDASYARFREFYLSQQAPRSVDASWTNYRTQNGHQKTTKPAHFWRQWANGLDTKGNPIPGAVSWAERAQAYDDYNLKATEIDVEAARRKLVEDELADYTEQLDKWRVAYQTAQYHERDAIRTVTDKDTGVVTQYVVVKSNAAKMRQLTQWRDDISRQGRRALGLPDRITESHQNLSGAVTVKRPVYIEVPSDPE